MTEETKKSRQVLTPEFRLSFSNLEAPKPNMNGLNRFEMEMLFPKDRGGSQFGEMMALYNETLKHKALSGDGPAPRTFKQAIIDGNSKKQEGRHGMYMIKANASEEYPPRLLTPNRVPAHKGLLYEGCWARAILTCYPYVTRKDRTAANSPIISRGAAFSILVVQFVRDDKPFANYVTEAEQDELLAAHAIPGTEDDTLDLLS